MVDCLEDCSRNVFYNIKKLFFPNLNIIKSDKKCK